MTRRTNDAKFGKYRIQALGGHNSCLQISEGLSPERGCNNTLAFENRTKMNRGVILEKFEKEQLLKKNPRLVKLLLLK